MDKLLALEPGMLIWTFITFGLLLFILKKFAWKPLVGGLEKREERIRSDIHRAEHAKEESEKLLAEHKRLMTAAELDARRIIEEARKSAEHVRSDIVNAANEQARQLAVQAKAEIQREKESALAQLRNEIADLAILAAGKILQESIDEAKGRTIVDSFVAGMRKN